MGAISGGDFMWATRLLGILLSVICLSAAQETTTYVTHYLEPFPGPQVYKDRHSTTTLYVETDGRHVAAISGDGKLLWKDRKTGLPTARTISNHFRVRRSTRTGTAQRRFT